MEKEDLLRKVEKLANNNLRKLFLILIKYSFHFIAFIYVLNTTLSFCGIDSIWTGFFFHISLYPWIVFVMISIIFKFCFVHRLPLYYIAINEILTNIDYYIGIPMSVSNLLIIHLILLVLLMFGYSYYHINKHKFKCHSV